MLEDVETVSQDRSAFDRGNGCFVFSRRDVCDHWELGPGGRRRLKVRNVGKCGELTSTWKAGGHGSHLSSHKEQPRGRPYFLTHNHSPWIRDMGPAISSSQLLVMVAPSRNLLTCILLVHLRAPSPMNATASLDTLNWGNSYQRPARFGSSKVAANGASDRMVVFKRTGCIFAPIPLH